MGNFKKVRLLRPEVVGLFLLAFIMFPIFSHADDRNIELGDVAPDPAGTKYSTGLEAIATGEFRSFKHLPPYRAFLPQSVDLSQYFPLPGNQGQLPSCTAWATGYAARGYYSLRVEGKSRDDLNNLPSPEYIYNKIKKDAECKRGSSIRDALELLKQGAISITEYPNKPQSCATIDDSLTKKAAGFKIQDWYAVNFSNADDIKGEISRGSPVIFGMRTSRSFEDLRGTDVFSATKPTSDDGHAMTVTGYDDTKQAFRVINSWGRGWGDKGFGWISYDTVAHLADEAYAMKVEKPIANVPVTISKIEGATCASIHEKNVDGKTEVSGFVETDADAASVRSAYEAKGIKVSVDIRPWPQCEILQTLQSQLEANDRPSIVSTAKNGHIAAGANLSIAITSPSWPAYLYTNYVQADGSVVTLSQPSLVPLHSLERNTKQVFGDGLDGRDKFTVSAPYGKEMIVVLAARSPLFEEKLPDKMTERDFLSLVRKAIVYKPDPNQPDRQISATILPIETQEK